LINIVDMSTGKPCVDFLDNPDLWVPGTTLTGLLQSLQVSKYIQEKYIYI